jgi:hypothetical protein
MIEDGAEIQVSPATIFIDLYLAQFHWILSPGPSPAESRLQGPASTSEASRPLMSRSPA